MSFTNTDESKKIPLGSGTLYAVEYTGTVGEDSAIEVESNIIGHIKGGASIEYKPSFYTAKSDDGKAQKTIITGEDAKFKYGQITWNFGTLKKLTPTARVTEATGKRTTKIGGISNDDGKKYLLRFVHTDKVDGDMRITIVGVNTGGWSAAFAPDKEAMLSPEFSCEPIDSEGSLAILSEDMLTSGT